MFRSFRCFGDQFLQCLFGVVQETIADWPFPIDETPNCPLVYPEAPRKGRGSTEQLDAVSEMILSILHMALIVCPANEAMLTDSPIEHAAGARPAKMMMGEGTGSGGGGGTASVAQSLGFTD